MPRTFEQYNSLYLSSYPVFFIYFTFLCLKTKIFYCYIFSLNDHLFVKTLANNKRSVLCLLPYLLFPVLFTPLYGSMIPSGINSFQLKELLSVFLKVRISGVKLSNFSLTGKKASFASILEGYFHWT